MRPAPGEVVRRQATLWTHRIHALPVVVLMPHSRCNCRCVMCDIWKANDRREELSRDDLAAHVKAFEELGATALHLSRLWTDEAEFEFASRWIAQRETFFLVAGHSEKLQFEVGSAHHPEGIQEMRWWSLGEIEKSVEPIFPCDLATRVRTLALETDPWSAPEGA